MRLALWLPTTPVPDNAVRKMMLALHRNIEAARRRCSRNQISDGFLKQGKAMKIMPALPASS